MLWNSNEDTAKTLLNNFLLTCEVDFRRTDGQNNTRICDTEGFVPVPSLNGVVVFPSSVIRYLICKTRKI